MHRPLPRFERRCVAAGLLVALLAACAAVPQGVPAPLQPGGSSSPALTLAARGVQVYECRSAGTAAAPAWAFVAPEAELLDAQGRLAGHHGAGPFWQLRDGSRIAGSVAARADAPEPGAIPWLLLTARAESAPGALAAVTHVQRINTRGGVAPATGCSPATLGAQARVAYRADYRFLVAR
ncbi:DUF3455 domain-containing protein [Aquabacterium sp.]|uniref:DUF3455 domain-containing protein n=1 Tax=Aquabacterium sp. TaxID=1872578 RepID=UPI003783D24C